ncbi:MAG: methyltransferase [Deltaproteobacteria bacterium]|nr:methyltransferase [Deltaproteobacteria bacterium]
MRVPILARGRGERRPRDRALAGRLPRRRAGRARGPRRCPRRRERKLRAGGRASAEEPRGDLRRPRRGLADPCAGRRAALRRAQHAGRRLGGQAIVGAARPAGRRRREPREGPGRALPKRRRRRGESRPARGDRADPGRGPGLGTPPFELETLPGVFSARRLDPGSELLLEHFARRVREKAPKRLVDLGCGTGVLGLVAARLLPEAEILLVDADARAVECARRNAVRLGVEGRCRVLWWDAREKPPETGFDFALVNPPFHHRGPEVDLAPALALFQSLAVWLKRNGRALLVANRTLPYEAPLARQGEVVQVADVRGYKLLSLNRSARSSGARGRKAPGPRSGGSSRSPIRSR